MILLAFATPFVAGWGPLPDRVPLHYRLDGTPDGWGAHVTIHLLFAVAAIVSAGLLALTRVPHHYNYPIAITAENAEEQYRLARRLLLLLANVIPALFLYANLGTWRVATGLQSGLSPMFISFAVPAILTLVAGYFIAARRLATRKG